MNIIELTEARRHFVLVCQRAFRLGMQISSGGNISMRIGPSRYLVKPSGKALCDLEPADLLLCNGEGKIIEGEGKPTKEFASHLAIYEVRAQAGAIVHYHAPYATAFAAAGRELPLPTVHARRTLRRVPLITPPGEGTPEVCAALGSAFSLAEVRAALMAEHGIIAAGGDLAEAQNVAEMVEESARIAYLAARITASGPA